MIGKEARHPKPCIYNSSVPVLFSSILADGFTSTWPTWDPDISRADKDAAKLISKQFDGLALGLCPTGHFIRNKAYLSTTFLDLYPQICWEIQRLKIPGYTKSVADV